VNSKACSQIPYAAEQGIFAAITGNFFGITGKFNRASSEIAEQIRLRHFCDMARSVDFPPLAEERMQRTSAAMRQN
jgi:hypothetical protein